MANPEIQAVLEVFANQMREFTAGIIQQQHAAIQAMLTSDRGRASTPGVDEKYYKRVENFNGEQNWRDWAFQFKSATKTAQEDAYYLLEWAEKEQSEIDDDLTLKDPEKNISSAIFNILGTLVKGEPLQMLHTSGFSGLEAWRKLSKRYSPTTPMRGMQLLMAVISPGKARTLEEVSNHIDKWETKVLALTRDFKEDISDKMKAAILLSMLPSDLQHALIQQADKFGDYKSTKDRISTIVEAKLALKSPDAMDCDVVHKSSDPTRPEGDYHGEMYAGDIDAVSGKGGVFCYRCGGQGHIAAKCATPAPVKGKGKDGGGKGGKSGGKGANNKGKGKGEWQGFCSYCGKRGHGPRDCWAKQKDEANISKIDVAEVEEDMGGFEIGSLDAVRRKPTGILASNRFQALIDDADDDDHDICPLDEEHPADR